MSCHVARGIPNGNVAKYGRDHGITAPWPMPGVKHGLIDTVEQMCRNAMLANAYVEERIGRAQSMLYVAMGYHVRELQFHLERGTVIVAPRIEQSDFALEVRRAMREYLPFIGWKLERELKLL